MNKNLFEKTYTYRHGPGMTPLVILLREIDILSNSYNYKSQDVINANKEKIEDYMRQYFKEVGQEIKDD